MTIFIGEISCLKLAGPGSLFFEIQIDKTGIAFVKILRNESGTVTPGTFNADAVKLVDVLSTNFPPSLDNNDTGFFKAISDHLNSSGELRFAPVVALGE